MVQLKVRTERHDDVTFVAATVTNDGSEPRRVTLSSRLSPVWPPRRQGVTEAGWEDETVTLTVGGGERRGVGFASPDSVDGPVLSLEREQVVGDGEPESHRHTPDSVVRALGDPTPPGDVISLETESPAERRAPQPPRAVMAWLDRVASRTVVSDRDRRRVAAVAERTAQLAADLERR
jgi:hypothetical protein